MSPGLGRTVGLWARHEIGGGVGIATVPEADGRL